MTKHCIIVALSLIAFLGPSFAHPNGFLSKRPQNNNEPPMQPGEHEINLDGHGAGADPHGDHVRITGDSGNLKFRNVDGREISVQLKRLVELQEVTDSNNVTSVFPVENGHAPDQSGMGMGKSDHFDHKVDSFDKRSFQVSAPVVGTAFGINATTTTLTATLGESNNANVTLQVIIFAEAGNIVVGDDVSAGGLFETFAVSAGTMKFNIEIDNWPFCDGVHNDVGCHDASTVGKYLEATIRVKTNNNASIPDGAGFDRHQRPESGHKGTGPLELPEEISLAFDTSKMIVSQLVRLDNSWVGLPTGYPTIELDQDNETVISIRFPTAASIHYDPIVDLNSGNSAGALVPLLAAFALSLLSLITMRF